MSLPLTRRIAKAALLTAAGAASVVGAAGSASAVELQQPAGLSGLNTLDTAGTAAQETASPVQEAGFNLAETSVPTTSRVAHAAGERTAAVTEGQDAVGALPGTDSLPAGDLGEQLPSNGMLG